MKNHEVNTSIFNSVQYNEKMGRVLYFDTIIWLRSFGLEGLLQIASYKEMTCLSIFSYTNLK